MDKQTIRNQALAKRRALSDREVKVKSALIVNVCYRYCEHAKVVGMYLPIKQEVDLTALFQKIPQMHIGVPRVISDNAMEFVEWQEDGQMIVSALGIQEPLYGKVIQPQAFDVIFVPIVAFHAQGMRIGYGKGYYDRYLSKTKAWKIGVAYECQRYDTILSDPHDVPLDMIITEAGIYQVNNYKPSI